MDNKAIAALLNETADLMEITGRTRSRPLRSQAAQAIEALPGQVSDLNPEPETLLEVKGICEGMLAHLQMLSKMAASKPGPSA